MIEEGGFNVKVKNQKKIVKWKERYRIEEKGGGKMVDEDVMEKEVERVDEENGGKKIKVLEILKEVELVMF